MIHTPRPAFAATSGPVHPRMVLCGEAWGESEENCHKPFAGESGKELWRMLGEAMPDIEPELHAAASAMHRYGEAWIKSREAWLAAAGIAMTNVLAFRPPGNKIEELCYGSKKEAGELAGSYPPLARGKYLREEYLGELDRLGTEIFTWNPNLVVALGNTACWAVLQATNIGSIRGAVTNTCSMRAWHDSRPVSSELPVQNPSLAREYKCLSTYHPAGVLRQWAWRPIVVADLMKAHREAGFPEIRRPQRKILVSPSLAEMYQWENETFELWKSGHVEWLAPDIETAAGQITCIGFARSQSEAMVIPFWDRAKPGYNYWETQQFERDAFDVMARLLESEIPKIWQNGMYDIQYLTRYGIQPRNNLADTMLLHHSLFPELQKGLGFLGSIYTGESSWKLLRKRKADTEKKDE